MNLFQNEVIGTSGQGPFSFYGSLDRISSRFPSIITHFMCFSIPFEWVSSWGVTSPGIVSRNVDSFSYFNKSTLRISKSVHEKRTKLKKTYAILLLPDLGAHVLKRKTSIWQMHKITHLQKQQRNNKDLGHPTIVGAFGCYTMEIPRIS